MFIHSIYIIRFIKLDIFHFSSSSLLLFSNLKTIFSFKHRQVFQCGTLLSSVVKIFMLSLIFFSSFCFVLYTIFYNNFSSLCFFLFTLFLALVKLLFCFAFVSIIITMSQTQSTMENSDRWKWGLSSPWRINNAVWEEKKIIEAYLGGGREKLNKLFSRRVQIDIQSFQFLFFFRAGKIQNLIN